MTYQPDLFPHLLHGLLLVLSWCIAGAVLALFALPIWEAAQTAISVGQQMHQIPCADCCFHTGDYALKCTVHPYTALSAAAIDCPDQRPKLS